MQVIHHTGHLRVLYQPEDRNLEMLCDYNVFTLPFQDLDRSPKMSWRFLFPFMGRKRRSQRYVGVYFETFINFLAMQNRVRMALPMIGARSTGAHPRFISQMKTGFELNIYSFNFF